LSLATTLGAEISGRLRQLVAPESQAFIQEIKNTIFFHQKAY